MDALSFASLMVARPVECRRCPLLYHGSLCSGIDLTMQTEANTVSRYLNNTELEYAGERMWRTICTDPVGEFSIN